MLAGGVLPVAAAHRVVSRRLAAGLLIACLFGPGGAHAQDGEVPVVASDRAHRDLCSALLARGTDLAAVRSALDRGANPNSSCSVPYTRRKIHAAGALMSIVTGGLWLLTPILDEDLLTEAEVHYRAVPPLRLAADLRDPALMGLLLDAGASVGSLDGAFQDAVDHGDLSWATHLVDLGVERRLTHLPPVVFEKGQLESLLAMQPDLTGLTIAWTGESAGYFGRHPGQLDDLLAAGLPPTTLDGAFSVAVEHDELAWAEVLADRGARRDVQALPSGALSSEQHLQRVINLDPDLSGLRISVDRIHRALDTNPVLVEQLTSGGFDLVDLAFDLLAVGDYPGMERLFDAGLEPGAVSKRRLDRTLLARAVRDGEAEAVVFLLDRGAVPVQHGDYHPVDEAAFDGRLDLVALLIGALPDGQRAPSWESVLRIGSEFGNPEVVEAALPHVVAVNPQVVDDLAFDAAYFGRAEVVDILVARSARPAHTAQRALHAAAANGYAGLVHALVAAGADVDGADPGGDAALHLAVRDCYEDRSDVLSALFELGADPSSRDASGATALELALVARNDRNAGALLAGGADPNAPLTGGSPPLEDALDREAWGMATILIDEGAEVHRRMIREAVFADSWLRPPLDLLRALVAHEDRAGPAFYRGQARWARFFDHPEEEIQILEAAADERRDRRRGDPVSR